MWNKLGTRGTQPVVAGKRRDRGRGERNIGVHGVPVLRSLESKPDHSRIFVGHWVFSHDACRLGVAHVARSDPFGVKDDISGPRLHPDEASSYLGYARRREAGGGRVGALRDVGLGGASSVISAALSCVRNWGVPYGA